MGNALAHFPRRLRVLLHAPTSSRIECYDAEAENELRHSNSSSGFKIGSAGRHDALMHTRNLRGACSSNFSSSQKADPVCVVNICTSCQELADCVLASDVQYKSVAVIAAIISSFAVEAPFDAIKGAVSQCCAIDDLEVLRILQDWICKGLFKPIGRESQYTASVCLSNVHFVHPVVRSIDQKLIIRLVSALQNIAPQCSALNCVAWFAYVHAITAKDAQDDDQTYFNLAVFSIVQFLNQCLGSDSIQLEISQARTLDAIAGLLRRLMKHKLSNHLQSHEHIHVYALFAACSLKRQDVFAAACFAGEALRLIKLSWKSLLLKRSVVREPMEIADFVVVCQCAWLSNDFITAQGMCAKIIVAGNSNSYFSHSILYHGHVLKAMTNLLQGTLSSTSFHLECAKAFSPYQNLDSPGLIPEIRCLHQVDSHFNLAIAAFHFLTGLWCMSSMHLQKQRNKDILADSLGGVLHMLALQKVPSQCMCSIPKSETERALFADECQEDLETDNSGAKIIVNNDPEELWNISMEDAGIKDAVSARFVGIAKMSADLRVSCIHSPLCFAYTLRLLLDKRATEALDICECWLVGLENIGDLNPECFIWYRIAYSACRALAYAILSQGIKARENLIRTQKELEICDLPGLRGYISFIGLLAAGALCAKRQNAVTNSSNTDSIWTNAVDWKQCAVSHIMSCQMLIDSEVSVPIPQTGPNTREVATMSCDTRYKRRVSNLFEHQEVIERTSFLNDSDLVVMIMNQHTSLSAALRRMKQLSSVEQIGHECIFFDLFDQMNSWKSELDQVIVSAAEQKQRL